jgi:hypothetical protein
MSNSNRQDGNETYGDGTGKSGNGTEQAGVAERSLRYQDRFNQNSTPQGHDMGDTDKVRG